MPLYTYRCQEGHEFDSREALDTATIPCRLRRNGRLCNLPAKRKAVYHEQGVIFKGPGFTTSVIPPAAPPLPETKGESAETAFEKQDEFATKQYEHDKNVRPYIVGE